MLHKTVAMATLQLVMPVPKLQLLSRLSSLKQQVGTVSRGLLLRQGNWVGVRTFATVLSGRPCSQHLSSCLSR